MSEFKRDMNKDFAIVCDSAADLPYEFYQQHEVKLVPFHVRLGSEDLLDIQEAVPEDFYVRFVSENQKVRTSYPAPAEFFDAYEELVEQGYRKIISIHISDQLSGSYEAAMSAVADIPDSVQIEVINTKTASAAEGFVVADLVSMRDAGVSFEDAIAHAKTLAAATKLYFVPTEKNAIGNKKAQGKGIFANARHFFDKALGLRFLEEINEDGKVSSVSPSPSIQDSAGKIARNMSLYAKEQGKIRYIEINAGVPHALTQLEKPLNTNEFEATCAGIANAGPAIACHVGVGCVGLAFVAEDFLFDKDFAGYDAWRETKAAQSE